MANLPHQSSSPLADILHAYNAANHGMRHFIIRDSHYPIVVGHLDKDLRYTFLHYESAVIRCQDAIGKTDTETFFGGGIQQSEDFKREVLETGSPNEREIVFQSEAGPCTFLMYAEPVFNLAHETIGVQFIGIDITNLDRGQISWLKSV